MAWFAPELNVACRTDGDLDVPAAAAEAFSGTVGEALRYVAAYAGMRPGHDHRARRRAAQRRGDRL
jgi:hypothetical protein